MSRQELLAELAVMKSELGTVSARIEKLSVLLANADQTDPYLDLDEIKRDFDLGRAALKGAAERGELEIHQSSRRRLVVRRSELERWLASRVHKPNVKTKQPANDGADSETRRELQLQQLAGVRG